MSSSFRLGSRTVQLAQAALHGADRRTVAPYEAAPFRICPICAEKPGSSLDWLCSVFHNFSAVAAPQFAAARSKSRERANAVYFTYFSLASSLQRRPSACVTNFLGRALKCTSSARRSPHAPHRASAVDNKDHRAFHCKRSLVHRRSWYRWSSLKVPQCAIRSAWRCRNVRVRCCNTLWQPLQTATIRPVMRRPLSLRFVSWAPWCRLCTNR